MAQFIPESSLLDHVYIPFYSEPNKKVNDCSGYFTFLESDTNGVTSIINLSTEDTTDGGLTPVVPFIDIGKFDPETRDWYWMDASGFPYRISSSTQVTDGWALKAMWPINFEGVELQFNPEFLNYSEDGKELGFYSIATDSSDEEFRMYPSNPIMVTIEGKVLKDKTIYGNESTTTGLTDLNVELNPEFYYNSLTNKIHTNQNLLGFDLKRVKVYYYESIDEISVKARLSTNAGNSAKYTPVIDYYIAKLNGQFLRG